MIPVFPLAVFLIPYVVFLLVYVIFFFFNSFHLRHFAVAGTHTTLVVFIYFSGTVILLGASLIALFSYQWSTPVDLNQILSQLIPNGSFSL